MQKRILGAVAMAALLAPGVALAADDHQGVSFSIGALQVDGDYEYTGGKPTQEISGAMPTFRIGYDHQFGSDEGGFVLGASYFSTFGDALQSGPVRDGNYLVQDGTLDTLSGWEVRAGWAFGDFMPYLAYGETEREGLTRQSCPNDPASTVAGFCYGGGVPATQAARAGQREGSLDGGAETTTLGLEWNVSANVFLDLRYSETDFGTQIVSLAPTGNTAGQLAHPDTNPNQSLSAIGFQVGYRF